MQQSIEYVLRENVHTYSHFSYCEDGKISNP